MEKKPKGILRDTIICGILALLSWIALVLELSMGISEVWEIADFILNFSLAVFLSYLSFMFWKEYKKDKDEEFPPLRE